MPRTSSSGIGLAGLVALTSQEATVDAFVRAFLVHLGGCDGFPFLVRGAAVTLHVDGTGQRTDFAWGEGATAAEDDSLPLVADSAVLGTLQLRLDLPSSTQEDPTLAAALLQAVATLLAIGIARRDAAAAADRAHQHFITGPAMAFRWDNAPGWPILYVSPNVAQFGFRPDALLARPFAPLVHPGDLDRIAAEVERHTAGGVATFHQEYRIRCPDGVVRWVDDYTVVEREEGGRVAGFLGYLIDATERRAISARAMQMDRMVAVGTLAAGVAHEINNPLVYVGANLEFAARRLGELSGSQRRGLDDVIKALADANAGTMRVAGIVRDLNLLARADVGEPGAIALVPVLESAIAIARATLHARAQLVCAFQPVQEVHGTATRLGQVFLNLLVNAAQAIPPGNPEGNTIQIGCRPGQECVIVEVADTGNGIPSDVLPRIFDPFFTTKPVGEGTGLGLSICRGIVNGLGGSIEVNSEPGGTTFTVRLPLAASNPADPIREPAPPPRRDPAAGPRILVIDDDGMVIAAVERVLERFHPVTGVTSAEDAMALLSTGERFDVVLCDMVMPGMNGMAFFAAVHRLDERQADRIVFTTGGAWAPDMVRFLAAARNPALAKPFGFSEVREAVNRIVNEQGRYTPQ